MSSHTSLPIFKNICNAPTKHSYKEVCSCPTTKWYSSKELLQFACYFDKMNIYPSIDMIEKIVLNNKLDTLHKCQLIAGCIQYSIYKTEKIAFSKTKKECSDSILKFIQKNILMYNELCYLGIPVKYYKKELDCFFCEHCHEEYTYISSLDILSACHDDKFNSRCCVKVICADNEACMYEEPEYRD
tara:strand:+ start:236 stop:793 length:558 start_codon:yes stop_codon:yes gene_type:complete